MELFSAISLPELVSTIVYTVLGASMLCVLWWIIEWITPFSVSKEIEQDQNVALAVVLGALFIALAIIIGAVLLS
ncbi:DUF350 domain-containing protein [Pseudaestuariivita atlantica]|uniref:DUF350 domain-containing protein n=1 Tax=Pseudaestuariivita atlantica TaxID=1317121 RepID=A0A0L1JPJ2_9RHOB|nr:DUF350 domain-containing protein [Pseudaestuariivita atlantica]KNG93323.1 hypothetical protein ATO11_12840 [Pseudaestuariivita atlantica]